MLETAKKRLSEFYAAQIRPFTLASPRGGVFVLSNAQRSAGAFDEIRRGFAALFAPNAQ